MLDQTSKGVLFNLLSRNGFDPLRAKLKFCCSGGNNKIILVEYHNQKLLAKFYFSDDRDRLGSEWAFLNYAKQLGIQSIPQPIDHESSANVAVYSFIEGKKLSADEISVNDIEQACDFIQALNPKHNGCAVHLPFASEASFSISDHVQVVEARLLALQSSVPQNALKDFFANVLNGLISHWTNIKWKIKQYCVTNSLGFTESLERSLWCVSPSDFGFHNVIRSLHGHNFFIDFEYAGWDDPAKMVADFFLQPAVPVNIGYFNKFAEKVFSNYLDPEALMNRTRLLYPLFIVKWCCIILNCFIPKYMRRQLFANQDINIEHLQQSRLKKANEYLALLETDICEI